MPMGNFSRDNFLIMYHGGLMPDRGIEILIDTLTLNPKIYLFLLGDGREDYIAGLVKYAEKKGVDQRVSIHQAVSYDELWKYVGAADAGMIMIRDAWKSYYYMLPNKLFENIQSETPVVCSNFPVITKLVEEYQIGLTCDPKKPEEIHRCIMRLWSDKEFYGDCKGNLKTAKEELCWENEKTRLKDAYRRIL